MNATLTRVPWRLGATSYVIEDGLVENAEYLAGRVEDMQLVLFDLPDGPSNLPDPAVTAELARIQRTTGLGYTVHLLSDIAPMGGSQEWQRPLEQAQDLIQRTRSLNPVYVLHLDGQARRSQKMTPEAWLRGILHSLDHLAAWIGDRKKLAVENLEGYAPDFVVDAVVQAGVSRCVDVGHLWLDGVDPVPWLAQACDVLRVVHLHGVDARDHVALRQIEPARLDAIVHQLLRQNFNGVLTLEVFGNADFEASMQALEASMARVQQAGCRF